VITGGSMRRGWEGPLTTASPASKDDLQNIKYGRFMIPDLSDEPVKGGSPCPP